MEHLVEQVNPFGQSVDVFAAIEQVCACYNLAFACLEWDRDERLWTCDLLRCDGATYQGAGPTPTLAATQAVTAVLNDYQS